MPDLNLNDEGNLDDLPSEEPSQPEGESSGEMTETESSEGTEGTSLRERGGQGARMVIILVVLAVLAGAVYMVNKLGIVKLWGTSEPIVAQVEEQPYDPSAEQQPAAEQTTPDAAAEQAAQQAAAQQAAAQQAAQPPAQQAAPPQSVAQTPKVTEKQNTEMPMKLLDPIQFPKRSSRPVAKQTTPVQQQQVQVASVQKQEAPPERKLEAKPVQQQPATAKTEPVAQATPPVQAPKTTTQAAQNLPKVNMASLSDMQGGYTVQVYALRDKGNAETVVQRLSDAGYPAFLEEISAREMMWYTVRVGKYPSAADAKKAVENFAQEIKMHHFIDKVRMTGN
jgi:cell division septation protein DedD